MKSTSTRRAVLLAAATGAVLISPWSAAGDPDDSQRNEDRGPGEAKGVGSVEDLMREHGVLRRITGLSAERPEAARRQQRQSGSAQSGRTAVSNLWRRPSPANTRGRLHLPDAAQGSRTASLYPDSSPLNTIAAERSPTTSWRRLRVPNSVGSVTPPWRTSSIVSC